jgi:hypothetical protein
MFQPPMPCPLIVRRSIVAALVAALALGAAPAAGAASPLLSPLIGRPTHAGRRASSARTATGFLTPQELHTAYALPDTGARHQTIAILSVYNDPFIQADLNAFDKQFGLPACAVKNGCFRELNQNGKSSPLPETDPSGGQWMTESALGVEIAHSICQSCKIVLAEANTPYDLDTASTAAAAAKAGATVVVTSITPTEQPSDESYWGSYFSAPRTAFVAAAGDAQFSSWGFSGEVDFPSSLPNVLAVGGTRLTVGRGGSWRGERTWAGTVSGCSAYNRAPTWQTQDAAKVGCGSLRSVADVAAMAQPGIAVQITCNGPHHTCITASGSEIRCNPCAASGTSAAAPIIAGVIGLAGSVGSREAQMLYEHASTDPGAFHDIVAGANSPDCTTLQCEAGPGYDGPTGLGTPHGLAAFLASGGALQRRDPRISLSAPSNGLRTNGRWATRLTIRNGNAFAVAGGALIRARVRLGGHWRTIEFAHATLNAGPLQTITVKLNIIPRERGLLGRLRSVAVDVLAHVHGAAGRAVTVKRRLTLYAP